MTATRHSARLRGEFEPLLPELFEASGAVIRHPEFRALYPEFLITLHQFIRASVPVMRVSLARCRELAASDAVAAEMVDYYEHHIEEEMHHDDWVLEDLEVLGIPRADVLRRMPPPAIASYVGAQYYWILHHHPVAQFGQIAVQEGYPPSPESIDDMVARTGLPRAAFRTLEKHAHLDPNHRDDFDAALDRMPLGEEHHAVLRTSVRHAVRLSAAAYRAVARRAAVPERRPDLIDQLAGDGSCYRVTDPVRGTVYRIGAPEKFLLDRCDGLATPAGVCRAFRDQFGEPLSGPELTEFLDVARAEHWFAETAE